MEIKDQAREIVRLVDELKKTAIQLYEESDSLPAARRNVARVLASIKMLELNFSDPFTLEKL